MFNFNFDKACSTSHSIHLRRFRPKNGFCTHNQTVVEAIVFRSLPSRYLSTLQCIYLRIFMRELNFSKFLQITYYLSALFQTKIGFCIFIQTEVETVVFRSIIKVFINLTIYLSSNFYTRIEFLKNLSDYIVFIYNRNVFLSKNVKM